MHDLMLKACIDSWFRAHDEGAIFSDELLMTCDKDYRRSVVRSRWEEWPGNIDKTKHQLNTEYQSLLDGLAILFS